MMAKIPLKSLIKLITVMFDCVNDVLRTRLENESYWVGGCALFNGPLCLSDCKDYVVECHEVCGRE